MKVTAHSLNSYYTCTYDNIGGDDYVVGPYVVAIPAGRTRLSFDVPILGDNILEGDEQFLLVISNSLPDRVTISNPDQTIVTIKDNDRELNF